MIVVQCEQGTPEWLKARLGIPTASCFDKIITPGGAESKQANAYANTLLAEWLTQEPLDSFSNEWMERGILLEAEARKYYRFLNDEADVQQVGFVTNDEGTVGASPDSLVDANGLMEIKCPKANTHIQYLLDNIVPNDYVPQVQGQLWIAEREWVDFLSYYPGIEPVLIRVHRDEAFILKLSRFMRSFLERLEEKRAVLIERGIQPAEAA